MFGHRWKSIRAALLTKHKYVALVNNFGDTEATIEALEAEGAINLRHIYNIAKDNLNTSNLNFGATSAATADATSLDQKLGGILQRQQQNELADIYPQVLDTSGLDDTAEADGSPARVDYKKSLEQVIREDAHLDDRRLVDATLGTAGLHEFIPATKLKGMEDWVLESDHYKYYSTTTDFPLCIEMETQLEFPENLHIFTYEKGNISDFMRARRSCTNVSSHYIMNGASVLPPLALGIQPGDRVLDACASPGGKSLLMLQTLHPDVLVCNDLQHSRINRVEKTLSEFIFDFQEKWNGRRCILTQQDARVIQDYGTYDRILVDVPCTTDRRAAMASENNIFKASRVKERLQLPELQAAILTNCIQLLKPGGSLVYATCSLSPVQNDGVVHMALSNVFRDYSITATIK